MDTNRELEILKEGVKLALLKEGLRITSPVIFKDHVSSVAGKLGISLAEA